jgi:hypothetical protein
MYRSFSCSRLPEIAHVQLWRIKSESADLPVAMSFRLCGVTVIDLEGVRHTAEVTASTLYEAVALGIMAIREQEWAGKDRGGSEHGKCQRK